LGTMLNISTLSDCKVTCSRFFISIKPRKTWLYRHLYVSELQIHLQITYKFNVNIC